METIIGVVAIIVFNLWFLYVGLPAWCNWLVKRRDEKAAMRKEPGQ